MKKWLKRLVLYPLAALMLLIVVFFFFKKDIYYSLKGMVGSQLQWFGYNERGSRIIESALAKNSRVNSSLLHGYSVQNTKNGNYAEAVKYLDEASELDSASVDGYYGWCLLYYYRDYDKALFHLERLDRTTDFVDYVGDDNILYAKGLCYKGKKEYEKALELLEESIQHELTEHDNSWVTHQMFFQAGRTLHLLNKPTEAISYYNRALDVWDGSSESIYYKGLAEIELGIVTGCDNLEKALQKLRKGIKSSDAYVSLFDEIYQGQVEESISSECN